MGTSREALRSTEGLIFAVDQTAVHDGPGVRMMVYLKGCPLRCVWCHSPESINPRPEVVWYETRCVRCGKCVQVCPEGLREPAVLDVPPPGECRLCGACIEACELGALEVKGRPVTAGALADEAIRLRPFFRRSGGGVTLSGGEPMLQAGFAYAIAALCTEAGIHVALETTGHVAWAKLKRMTRVVDLFLYDLKQADPQKHRAFTGVGNRLVLANLRRLTETGADVVVRVPLIPGHNDSPEDVRAIARSARKHGATKLTLLPYNPATPGKYAWLRRRYPLTGAPRQSAEEIARLRGTVEGEGLTVGAA